MNADQLGERNSLLIAAAKVGSVELCMQARSEGAEASYEGHTAICELAKSWGAVYFDQIMVQAERGGHPELCRLAKEWPATV